MDIIATDAAPAAIGPYSQATRLGNQLFCSGQIALAPGGTELVSDGVEEQTRQALTNLAAVLKAGGARLDSVLKATVYLLTMDDFPAMNGVYQEVFGDHRPARACVAVSQLPKGARVEIDAIAAVVA